jgi:plasmid stabilization system protein ParE
MNQQPEPAMLLIRQSPGEFSNLQVAERRYIAFYRQGEVIILLAVLHAARNPAEWQRRI